VKDVKAKIFLVDDHPLFREGVANLINRLPDLRVCGEAESAAEALRAIVKTKPNVAVVDLSLKEGSGLELIKEIKKASPSTAIIVLSMHDERRYAERSVRAGARGYVMKIESANHVIAAIREVLGGKLYLSQKMRAEFVERFVDGAPAQSESPADLLSNRELEVFQLLGQGYETRRVAEKMGVSIKTVQAFCAKIKGKLHLANASELLHEAVRWSENQATP
jgi:DNA-binding NarL/FixJ family response regulator